MKKIYILLFSVLLISLISAEVSYCCEKTTYGAWCQNDAEDKCDTNFQKSPTSCEATSYCREGCCYNSQEGTCLPNTPQKICQEKKGVWSSVSDCDIPQCDLGCCLMGDQAAFVTQTRCKRISSLYGLQTNFRKDILNEVQCIASVTSKAMGACVFEKEFERTCLMITKKECIDMDTQGTETEFYEGHLCSDEKLATNCGPSEKTTCVEGRDAVYYLDTCGNLANIYDASKFNDKEYWALMKNPLESCGYQSSDGNSNSGICGNCDFFKGSTCKKYENTPPTYGDYICKSLDCEYKGQDYQHGETWCAVSGGGSVIQYDTHVSTTESVKAIKERLQNENIPGSRYFRLMCYNGEVIIEPCADYRQEICLQDQVDIGNGKVFRYGACVANKWQDCIHQEEEIDCENTDKRDCVWLDMGVAGGIEIIEDAGGICVPKYSPGFDFWSTSTKDNPSQTCEIGSKKCVVKYIRGIEVSGEKKDWETDKNEECDPEGSGHTTWLNNRNMICISLGDCGMSLNYLGYKGFYDEDEIIDKSGRLDKEELEGELS